MINSKHLFKVASAWISAVYVVCYAGVAIYPPIRGLFMRYSLHTDVFFKSDFFSFKYFLSGLIIWNIVIVANVWLFTYLFKRIKQ